MMKVRGRPLAHTHPQRHAVLLLSRQPSGQIFLRSLPMPRTPCAHHTHAPSPHPCPPQMKPEQWQEVMDVNLSGVFYCTQAR